MATKKKSATRKHSIWFTRTRRSYLPSAGPGFIAYMAYVVFIIGVIFIWYRFRAVGDWMIPVVFAAIFIGTAVMQAFASKHSK